MQCKRAGFRTFWLSFLAVWREIKVQQIKFMGDGLRQGEIKNGNKEKRKDHKEKQ